MESSSFSGSSKRAKAPGNITQVPHCLVDGCDADLSLCRDYHRRHKVCETHSKTPKVTIGSQEQRFCQQCSRFHSLVEFDEGKRSCRKRLDGHNRRRRKPQPDTLRRNPISDFSNQGGGTRQLLSFSSSHIPPSAIVGFSWGPGNGAHNNEIVGPHIDYQQQQLNSSSLREAASSLGQQIQLLDPNATAMGSNYCGGQRNMIFSDGLNRNNRVVDFDRALSLLSSSAATPLPTSLVNGLQYYNHDGFVAHEERSKDIHSSHGGGGGGGAAATLHFPEMFQPGQEGSSAGASHQTLTFMWE